MHGAGADRGGRDNGNNFSGAPLTAVMEPPIRRLLEATRTAISSTVRERRIGVAFSGGVDSSLVAKLCHDMGYDVTLLTVGFPGSHDIGFAKEINRSYGYPHEILEITADSFRRTVPRIRETIRTTDSLSWLENSIAFYYVSRLAHGLGIRAVVTANGADELFCGYDAYRRALDGGGPGRIAELMGQKLDNELEMMAAVNRVTSGFGVTLLQPLLSTEFVRFARGIPLEQKITGGTDTVRKHVLRRLAVQCGVPQVSCEKRKKAMQYGSLIHRELLRSEKTPGNPADRSIHV